LKNGSGSHTVVPLIALSALYPYAWCTFREHCSREVWIRKQAKLQQTLDQRVSSKDINLQWDFVCSF